MTKILAINLDGVIRKATLIANPLDQEIISESVAAIQKYRTNGWTTIAIISRILPSYRQLADCVRESAFAIANTNGIKSVCICDDAAGKNLKKINQEDVPEILAGKVVWHQWFSADEKDSPLADKFDSFQLPSPGILQFIRFFYRPTEMIFVGATERDERSAIAANVRFLKIEDWWNV